MDFPKVAFLGNDGEVANKRWFEISHKVLGVERNLGFRVSTMTKEKRELKKFWFVISLQTVFDLSLNLMLE